MPIDAANLLGGAVLPQGDGGMPGAAGGPALPGAAMPMAQPKKMTEKRLKRPTNCWNGTKLERRPWTSAW